MNLENLKRVTGVTFRKQDSAFSLNITEENVTEIVSMDIYTDEDWAPGFIGDCSFNAFLGMIQAITGHRFAVVLTENERMVLFQRQGPL